MTVRATGRPATWLEIVQGNAEHVLGARKARRVGTFDNGDLYVGAGTAVRFLAWLVDFTAYLVGFGVAFVALGLVHKAIGLTDDVIALAVLSLLLVVPLLYGLFYGNGRALGALLTGTQLVRVSDGGRIGAKACWAMLVRTLFAPVLCLLLLLNAFTTGTVATPGAVKRISIDRAATRQLHAAGLG